MSELTKTKKEKELLKIIELSKEPPAPLPWEEHKSERYYPYIQLISRSSTEVKSQAIQLLARLNL